MVEENTSAWETLTGICIRNGIMVPEGERLFVDANAALAADVASLGKNWTTPYATLQFAINQLTGNAGEVIVIASGHAETITAAADLIVNGEGVLIVGLGNGDSRPLFTFNGAIGADIDVTVDNVTFLNIKFFNTQDAATGPLDINAAYCKFIECEFEDDGADNTVAWIVLDANADDFLLKDCVHKGTDTVGNTSFITMGAAAHVRIENLQSHGGFSAANIEMTAAPTDILITRCHLENSNAVDVNIEGFAAATGWITHNKLRIATDGQVTWINTPGALSMAGNLGVNADGEAAIKVGREPQDWILRGVAGLLGQYGLPLPPGKRFFVDSGASAAADAAANGHLPEFPFATLDFAIGRATASEGDLIILMPGHAETIAAAGDVVFDKIGLTVVALGNGSNRATFTFDGTGVKTGDIDVTAAGTTWVNMIFQNTEDALVAPIDVDAAYFWVLGCEFEDLLADNTLDWFVIAAAGSDFWCKNCINKGTDTAGNDSFISVAGAADHIRIEGLKSNGDFVKANIEFLAAATDLLIDGCRLENANGIDVNIEGFAAITGWISHNLCRLATDIQTTWINTPGNASLFQNFGVNDDGETGILIGTPSA